jgi:hypothetical protein
MVEPGGGTTAVVPPVSVAVTGQMVVLTIMVSVVIQVELAGHEVTVDGQAVIVEVRVV